MQKQTGQGNLAEDDGIAGMEKKQGIPERKDQSQGQQAATNAKKTAWEDVLKPKATTAEKNSPMDCNRQTSI